VNTIFLTERRTVTRRIPRTDLDDLLRHYRRVIEVTPTFTRSVYRLAARGYVGTFRTTNLRWEIQPKLPWSALRWLASGPSMTPGIDSGPAWGAPLANLMADRLAELLRERTTAGLHLDYVEQHTEDATVRGRIDLPQQLRDGVRAGTRFHLVNFEFTTDVLLNRIPKAAARRLLAVPGLTHEVRQRLTTALTPFDGVSDLEPVTIDFANLRFDARTEAYRPLIRFAQLVLGQSPRPGEESFLINLEHLFQIHVAEVLTDMMPTGWIVEPQAPILLAPDSPRLESLTLRPDLVVRDSHAPRSVWDAKWKTLTASGPHPDDVHQLLGYAAAIGVKTAGLIYPGRKFFATVYRPSGSEVALHVVRLRLVGSGAECERAAKRLAHLIASRSP